MLAAHDKTKRRVETRDTATTVAAHYQNNYSRFSGGKKMESGILNARDCGMAPGFGYGETNRIALQRAVDEMRNAGGGTIYIPTGVYEVAGAVNVEISTAASATGTVRISGGGSATLVQSVESDLFAVTDAQDDSSVGHVLFEGLVFQGAFPATT